MQSSESSQQDELQPTIVVDPAPRTSAADKLNSLDVSRPDVGLFAGGAPRFSDETAELLRVRLKSTSLVLFVVMVFVFLGNLIAGNHYFITARAAILLAFVLSFFVLRSSLRLSLGHLRVFELGMFGAIGAQIIMMMYAETASFARQHDGVSIVALRHFFLTPWCVLILTYGIFVPNTWQRAALVLVPAAFVPYAVIYVFQTQFAFVAESLEQDHAALPVPMPLVAALVAVSGTHIINAVRREAFKARQFGQYHLKEQLGSGGMGEVHLAEHQLLKRPCAIKLIKPEKETDRTAMARFEREVQATSKLSHWNTIEIYDYGHTDDGTFYYVMELLPGMSLQELVQQHGPLPPERAIHFLTQTCSALAEAHATQLIHRDLKPANIFAAQRGGVFDVAKLLDFGLVKQQGGGGGDDPGLTQPGSFSGSPHYMSPEQVTSYSDTDERSDIYSLGAVAYHLLTGQPPFVGRSAVEIIVAHSRDAVIPPSALNSSIPADLEAIVKRCLQKDPAQRFQDVESLRLALLGCACAGDWTDERAEEWWKQVERKPDGPRP